MDKVKAWNEIELKWSEIQALWKDNFDIKNERIKLSLKMNLPVIEYGNKARRKKSQGFEVRFRGRDRGKDIVLSTKDMNASELLRRFIKNVGIESIKSLNVRTTSGRNMILDIANGQSDYSVFTKTPNSEKKDAIRQIIQELKINAEIIDIKD